MRVTRWTAFTDSELVSLRSGLLAQRGEVDYERAMRLGIEEEMGFRQGERATPHRITGTTRYERGIQGDERTDYGGPAGRYDQMVSDDA